MAEQFYAAGCDDGTAASGCGEATIDFDRDAESLESAVASAVANVRSAGYSVARVQIDDQDLARLAIAKTG
ncbi:MAG: hypothetical protein ACC645_11835 [Pirellulales bacterium]